MTTFGNPLSSVAEYMTRGNAYNYVQNRRVDPAPLLLGVARALLYLHSHPLGPIFHGDVRGKNVLVTDDGRALLTNFSCSCLHDRSSNMVSSSPLPGSLRWMAPEGIEEEDLTVDLAAGRDVWAFAMTIMELVTRQPPFEGINSRNLIIVRILRGMPRRPRCMRNEWWDLCTPCWKLEPEQRPDMMTLVHRIETMLSSRRSRFGDGHRDSDFNEDDDDKGNDSLIPQPTDELSSTVQIMPGFLKTTIPTSNYSAQPIGIAF
ncbi:kinase-like domain-containing protein [Scleroderma citrinum]